ncbi:unnamed protein product [Phaeothamnion confervicola]
MRNPSTCPAATTTTAAAAAAAAIFSCKRRYHYRCPPPLSTTQMGLHNPTEGLPTELMIAGQMRKLVRAPLGGKKGSQTPSPIWGTSALFEPPHGKQNCVCLVAKLDASGRKGYCLSLSVYNSGSGTGNQIRHNRSFHPDVATQQLADSNRSLATKEAAAKTCAEAGAAGEHKSQTFAGPSATPSLTVPLLTSSLLFSLKNIYICAAGVMDRFLKLSVTQRRKHNRNYVVWCAVNCRPFSMINDVGAKLFIGGLSPPYMCETISDKTRDKIIEDEWIGLRESMQVEMEQQRLFVAPNGGPYLCMQLDMTTCLNTAYCTMSVSFINKNAKLVRLALACRSSPGSHRAEHIADWVDKVINLYLRVFLTLTMSMVRGRAAVGGAVLLAVARGWQAD